ncbi:hypothetical protein P873_13035 [Arenimonas composti TR7-09 = DSM 18010]|uniref:Uncharacterized protein n=1 Tax=Arenimonas composti TR7-09 = DSM 18010 TaxID=1121013 RepID=A0A091BAW1_9GAMM|nr:hypothetical protein P873_13035 [Arenimonas composti TR7-09 = DSM 18010]
MPRVIAPISHQKPAQALPVTSQVPRITSESATEIAVARLSAVHSARFATRSLRGSRIVMS